MPTPTSTGRVVLWVLVVPSTDFSAYYYDLCRVILEMPLLRLFIGVEQLNLDPSL